MSRIQPWQATDNKYRGKIDADFEHLRKTELTLEELTKYAVGFCNEGARRAYPYAEDIVITTMDVCYWEHVDQWGYIKLLMNVETTHRIGMAIRAHDHVCSGCDARTDVKRRDLLVGVLSEATNALVALRRMQVDSNIWSSMKHKIIKIIKKNNFS